MGQVGNLDEQRLDPRVDVLHRLVERLDALTDLTHPRHVRRGVFAPLLGLTDRFRGAVAERLEVLGLLEETAPRGVVGDDVLDVLGAALAGQSALDRLGLLADQPEVQHSCYGASTGAALSDSTRATEPTRSSGSRSMI